MATTAGHTAYYVAWGRRFADATDLVPEDYGGTIARDGYVVYRNYADATHQTCVAHLLRRCVEIDRSRPKPNGSGLGSMRHRPAPALRPDRRLVKHLANERHALLSFLTDPNIDATNWRAEQAIRLAVRREFQRLAAAMDESA